MNLTLFVTVIALSCFGGSYCDKNSKKDCVGVIGFSSAGLSKVHATGLLQYKTNVYDSSHGWNRDTGTFTVKCPGVYSISFTGYGDADARFTLRKRTIANEFVDVVSTPPGGGTNTVMLSLDTAEQMSVKMAGNLRSGLEHTAPVNTFTMYRVSEK